MLKKKLHFNDLVICHLFNPNQPSEKNKIPDINIQIRNELGFVGGGDNDLNNLQLIQFSIYEIFDLFINHVWKSHRIPIQEEYNYFYKKIIYLIDIHNLRRTNYVINHKENKEVKQIIENEIEKFGGIEYVRLNFNKFIDIIKLKDLQIKGRFYNNEFIFGQNYINGIKAYIKPYIFNFKTNPKLINKKNINQELSIIFNNLASQFCTNEKLINFLPVSSRILPPTDFSFSPVSKLNLIKNSLLNFSEWLEYKN